jgi:hypothetical protein
MKEALKGALTGQVTTALGLVWKDISSSQQKPVTPQSPAPQPVKPAVTEDEGVSVRSGTKGEPSATPAPPGSRFKEPSAVVTPRSSKELRLRKDLSSSRQKPITPQSPVPEPVKPRIEQKKAQVGEEAENKTGEDESEEYSLKELSAIRPTRGSRILWSFVVLACVLGVVGALYLSSPKRPRTTLRSEETPKPSQPAVTSEIRFVDNGDGTVTDKKYGLVWSKKNFGKMTWREAVDYCRENRGNLPGSGWHLPTIDELRTLIIGCSATEFGGRCPAKEGCRSEEDCYGGESKANCAGCEHHKGPGPEGCYMDKALDDPCYGYWSSTPAPWSSSSAFFVIFYDGSVYSENVDFLYGVRCVRAGEALKDAVPTQTKPNLAPPDDSGARFVDNGDRTITDKKYGLVWSKKNFGNMTWRKAVEYCRKNRARLPGSGWHLPTIDELRTLIIGCPATEPGGRCAAKEGCWSKEGCYGGDWKANCAPCEKHKGPGPEGCYMDKAFDDPCGWYWSSTPCPWSLSSAFGVDFFIGNVNFVDIDFHYGVRCVRSGKD